MVSSSQHRTCLVSLGVQFDGWLGKGVQRNLRPAELQIQRTLLDSAGIGTAYARSFAPSKDTPLVRMDALPGVGTYCTRSHRMLLFSHTLLFSTI